MRELSAAAIARVQVVWTQGRVYEVGSVPATPVTPYLMLSVGSGSGENYTLDEELPGTRSHRLAVQAVGKTADEVEFAVEKADAAFLGTRLDADCTPLHPEVSSPIFRDPDAGGLLTCTVTYTTSKEQ
jgi:hypothetical protein